MELKLKIRKVKRSDFLRGTDGKIDVSRNVRYGGLSATIGEADVYSNFDFQMLVESIRQNRTANGGSGVLENPTVAWLDHIVGDDGEVIDDRKLCFPTNGNRRSRAWDESFIVNGVDTDPHKEAELTVLSIEAKMTSQEVAFKMMDHDQIGLRKIDFFEMALRATEENLSEIEFGERCFMVLPTIPGLGTLSDADKEKMGYKYLMSTKPEEQQQRKEAREKLRDKYRNNLQVYMMAAKLPDCVRDAWRRYLLGNQAWPTHSEVRKLWTAFRADQDIKAGGNIAYTRTNPGPQFLAKWQEILDSVKEAEANGEEKRSKSTAGKSRKELDTLRDAPHGSIVIRTCFAHATNTLPSGFNWTDFTKLQVRAETEMSVELKNAFNALFGLPPIPAKKPDTDTDENAAA